jgi:uncharacterized protein YcbK (DUF882 family)
MWTRIGGVAAACLLTIAAPAPTDALPEVLSLKLFNIHTQAQGTFVFKRNGVYDQAGLAQLNEFLRDWRKDQPTKMNPQLFDLLYQVYQNSGSHDYIHVVCGYRSPDTNAMLRRRSKLVAQNSLHMQGKAMDFFIPDVPLAKLRVIGLRLQIGGVGFYPTSGSPFVHMDVGNVRHWPRMTRQELAAVFPDGKTLDIPTDGKPMPGYAEALAEYQSRKANGGVVASYAVASNSVLTRAQVAKADAAADRTGGDDGPIQLASANDDETDDSIPADAPAAPAATRKAVAVAAYATTGTPLPRTAPRHLLALPDMVAMGTPPAPLAPANIPPAAQAPATQAAAPATHPPVTLVLASLTGPTRSTQPATGSPMAPDFDFGALQDWSSPAVPAALAQAMAARDQARRGASLPITPTSVVATIDVNRPLRAEAITTAVLRTNTDPAPLSPGVLAYADADMPAPLDPVRVHRASMTSAGVPLPQIRPRPAAVASIQPVSVTRLAVRPHMEAPALMLTSLDTQGLLLWMSPQSTRQKTYALLTMPDFAQMPALLAAPTMTFGAGFGPVAYRDLRTDRFSGPLVEQPSMVDLGDGSLIASIR